MGDASSPASDLALVPAHLEELDFVIEEYGNRLFVFQGFPTPLFAEIIKINYIRMRAAKYMPVGAGDLTYEAFETLNRIENFSPKQWAESKPLSKREGWTLLGKVHQVTVALYCIHSLQSVSVLPHIQPYREIYASHGQGLHTLLKTAMSLPPTKRFMLWPQIVLDVEAVKGGVAKRSFVQCQLPALSRHTGMLAPLTAKSVLEKVLGFE
ncbi:uncharacterized protein ACHE_10612A [Aspergillus chevalieri]|uniref:C6 finger domain protein n=1 Tax=Aspergillus chevalieri TaxID=182096 RepID=A0A7R7ZI18_ASPCH|nr:uncharacterized protein ACHE_10612A [Aspergillus chevalieri]BCR83210.1 hypothetical protein ACHE_10612A [Aspergillus chevalieri]